MTAPVFVTACNNVYLLQTKIMLRSLFRDGRISERQVCVMVFGPPREARVTALLLRAEFKKLAIELVNLARPEFRFLAEPVSQGDWAFVADYLRAWIGKKILPYVWMDSDILVNRDARPLVRLTRRVRTVALAADGELSLPRKDHLPGWMLADLYGEMAAVMLKGRGLPRRGAVPLNLNCGVIVVGKDASRDWRTYYERYESLARTPRFRRMLERYRASYGVVPVGQGIWNLIFAANEGQILDSDFNCLYPDGKATVDHYISVLKRAFPVAAVLKKLV